MGWEDTVGSVVKPISKGITKATTFVEKVIPNELDQGKRGPAAFLVGGGLGAGVMPGSAGLASSFGALSTRVLDMGEPIRWAKGSWDSGQEFPFMFEFPAIEALPPIEVNSIVSEIGDINRGTFKVNTGLADEAAQTTTAGIFDDFQGWLEKLLPGQGELVRSSAATVQEFIDTGLPRAVQNNAMARDAAALAAGGVRGTIGANRLLYNEAQRDVAGIQYGIGAAQQMVAQAQSVAGQFAGIQANLGSQYLGQLNQLTTISPAQAVGFAFDERAYQTGVEQFNATGMWNATTFSANYGLQAAQLDMQRQQFEAQLQAQREAEKSSRFGAIGSLLGAGAGLLLAPATGGTSLIMAAGIGSQIGGGLGQMAAGNYAGGTSQVLGGLGTYGGYQMQMDQYRLQQQQLNSFNNLLMNGSGAGFGTSGGLGYDPWKVA